MHKLTRQHAPRAPRALRTPALRAGWHGLTPILADIRGVLSRYNWIADLVTILDVPLENLANANLFPLPQVCVCVCVCVHTCVCV
jgi:hypothetical protein